jgi:signal transduction histidine kinase/ActR/RegA family two-component response regulator
VIHAIHPRARAIAALALAGFLVAIVAAQRGTPGSLLPHGYCFTWNPALLWTHVASDSLIGMAYVSIPLTLLHLTRKRTDIPFSGVVLLFALFIVSCGATHWIEVWTVWHPDYWLGGSVKLVTAVASVLTAIALVRLVPFLLSIPTVAELTAAKQALEIEVTTRADAENALLHERATLERRVLQRTEELARATAAAEAAHAAAQEANRLKDRFLAKVSHELRTPLQSTLSWAQVLQSTAAEPAQARQATERILHNVRAQARLIDDLLDISRILSGKLDLSPTRADAFEVIRQAADVVRTAALSRSVEIDVVIDDGRGEGVLDPVRLEQVVWNLINNAVQASRDGGRVRVRAWVDGPDLHVEVQDWGRGIDPVDLPDIFEPFRQGPTTGISHRGLGLGLAITRSIVDLGGGTVRAQSAGLGQGATFTLTLPLAGMLASRGAAADTELTAKERERLQGLRVLYVEDDVDIAEAGRLTLSALGARVVMCLSFDEAVERLGEGGFEMLVSDLNLGDGRSAIDLLALLRQLPHGRQTPAVVLSAYGSQEHVEASLTAGFASHLVKPAGATELARALLAAAEPPSPA